MIKNHTIGVVIPCYQVAQNVVSVIEGIPKYVDAIIAVNDASIDDTGQMLEGLRCERLTVLHHNKNRGVGGAMATGYRHAFREGIEIVVKLDGDGQMEPMHMIDLVRPIIYGTCDYAKGHRFLHTAELKKMPLFRKVGNIVLNYLTKISSGYLRVSDPQNGYLAIRTEFLPKLDLDRIQTSRYFFENEMLIQLKLANARVMDLPIPAVYNGSPSSLRISEVIQYYPMMLLTGFLLRILRRS